MIMYMYKKYKKICISNRHLVEGDFLEQICKVLKKKVDIIVLREKDLTEDAYEGLAKKVIELCQATDTICVLHSFCNVARKLNYPYIHLTMDDFKRLSEADKKFFRMIGVSTHTVEEAQYAQEYGASYVTASHIFSTECKPGVPPRGLEYLRQVCKQVEIDVYALGGIHLENISKCIDAGADGICMMSEYMQ